MCNDESINGALNAETLKVVMSEDSTVNAESTVELLKQLEALHPKAQTLSFTSFLDFQNACRSFFQNIDQFEPELRTLLRDKFQITDPVLPVRNISSNFG